MRIKNEALVAEAEAAKKVAIAQGDAEAEYNRKIAASLSPLIVQQMMIDKWNGSLPTFTGGNGTMLDASKFLK